MVDGIDSIVQSLNIYRISLWLMDVDAIDMIMQLDTLRVQNNLGKTSSDFRIFLGKHPPIFGKESCAPSGTTLGFDREE